jgi:ribosomal protein S18 acetylase RimI-like enzyme
VATVAGKPAIVIRAAAVSDAAGLAAQRRALFKELRQSTAPGREAAFEALSADAFREDLASGSCLAWLAVAGAETIGSVALLIFPRLPSPQSFARREGYLLNVYTDPSWRGLGVATALVATAVARARELGLARIRLHATAQGQPVYAAAGFAMRADEMELKLG